MSKKLIKIGTRASLLATRQAAGICNKLQQAGYPAELITINTPGDLSQAPIEQLGTGIFTTTLRQAIVDNQIDMAVHSYKDLPTAHHPELVIAAVPPREDPRDALVARDNLVLNQLPVGSVIGTSSPRRIAHCRALGLGLEIRPIRGNLDSRLSKVHNGELDAIVVARAGLARIGRLDVITETLDLTQMLPAPAQGALAIECRADNTALIEVLTMFDDFNTRVATAAERAVLAELHAGCSTPIGAFAEVVDSIDEDGRIFEELSLRCAVVAIDGSRMIRISDASSLHHPEELGVSLAKQLHELGALELM